jgi:hypothetical protein
VVARVITARSSEPIRRVVVEEDILLIKSTKAIVAESQTRAR